MERLLVNLLKTIYKISESNLRIKTTESEVSVSLLISFKDIDDLVNLTLSNTLNQRLHIIMRFDHLPKNNRTLDLLNEYNKNNEVFKGYVNDSGNLEVVCTIIKPETEELMTKFVKECLAYAENKNHINLLKPLTDITHE
jgi:hypothetical protein